MTTETGITIISPKGIDEAKSLAVTLAKSTLLSADFVGKEANVLMAIMTGAELGLAPMQSLRAIEVIKGKPTIKAEAMVALVRARRDVCAFIQCVESTPAKATWRTQRVGDPTPTELSWTMEQAKTAGLTGSDMYRKYPDLMLRWRCASMLIKLCYSDVILGLYDPEELRDAKAERDVTPPAQAASVIDSVATPLPTPPPAKVHRMTMVDEPAPSAAEDIASAIAAAPDRAALEGLVGRIRARPEPERATLRPAYEARLKAVAK